MLHSSLYFDVETLPRFENENIDTDITSNNSHLESASANEFLQRILANRGSFDHAYEVLKDIILGNN